MQPVIWALKELVELVNARIKNHFDSNCLVTGGTGLGKSSLINKLLLRFDGFNQWKHQVYSRSDIIKLLSEQKNSYCWADELISSAFKRTHYDTEQIELIETLTQYRCNENIFFGALPVFFTLDKELMKLFAINIDIIRRGVGVVHMRREGRRYTDDPWDTKVNAKLEEKWSEISRKNPNFKIPYHRYTTFVGYVYFEPLTEKQEVLYKEVRDFKKNEIKQSKEPEQLGGFYDNLLNMAIEKKLTENAFESICAVSGKEITSVRQRINQLLKSKGMKERLKDLLIVPKVEALKNKDILNELSNI
jgi:hypothetical protein